MKFVVAFFLVLMSISCFAQDPNAYLKNFDNKIYSLKSKGVKDFVVDIESSKLTKQINDQQLFGKVEELLFRIYWTATPERLAIEVIGLPEGFKEVKEELKASIYGLLDNLIPQTSEQRFSGYKFSQGRKSREIVAKDSSGIAPVPSFSLKFDEQERLVEVVGNKPVGTFVVTPVYKKEPFSDGKWVLVSQTTLSSENGQSMTVKKELSYGKSQGVAVVSDVSISTEYKAVSANAKTVKFSENIEFKNYKINEGSALKYFLGEAKSAPAATP